MTLTLKLIAQVRFSAANTFSHQYLIAYFVRSIKTLNIEAPFGLFGVYSVIFRCFLVLIRCLFDVSLVLIRFFFGFLNRFFGVFSVIFRCFLVFIRLNISLPTCSLIPAMHSGLYCFVYNFEIFYFVYYFESSYGTLIYLRYTIYNYLDTQFTITQIYNLRLLRK